VAVYQGKAKRDKPSGMEAEIRMGEEGSFLFLWAGTMASEKFRVKKTSGEEEEGGGIGWKD